MDIKLSEIFGTIWCVLVFSVPKVATLPGLDLKTGVKLSCIEEY